MGSKKNLYETMKAGQENKLQLLQILQSVFGEGVVMEYRFHELRKWRFDYAVPEVKLAVEYHGHAGFIGGKVSGHSTIKGLTNDCEKLNEATNMGWRVLLFTALHFREAERQKHKLTAPLETIRRIAKK
jgi:uncharacterized membrane protein YsdA (DUF1294 family)